MKSQEGREPRPFRRGSGPKSELGYSLLEGARPGSEGWMSRRNLPGTEPGGEICLLTSPFIGRPTDPACLCTKRRIEGLYHIQPRRHGTGSRETHRCCLRYAFLQ